MFESEKSTLFASHIRRPATFNRLFPIASSQALTGRTAPPINFRQNPSLTYSADLPTYFRVPFLTHPQFASDESQGRVFSNRFRTIDRQQERMCVIERYRFSDFRIEICSFIASPSFITIVTICYEGGEVAVLNIRVIYEPVLVTFRCDLPLTLFSMHLLIDFRAICDHDRRSIRNFTG
jgi:hypothetical protein